MANGQREVKLAELLADGLFLDGDWVESKDQDPEGDVRLIQLADIGDGTFRNRSRRFLTTKRANEMGCTFLEIGDILVARMPEPLGRACIFPGVGQPAVTAVDICIARPNPVKASPTWLVRAINSPHFRESMQAHVRGTTRQRISRKNLGALVLPVLTLKEQLAQVQRLDDLDLPRTSAQAHLSLARKALERFRQSILAAACSGRLTVDWRAGATSGNGGHNGGGLPLGWLEIDGSAAFTFITSGSRGWAKYYSPTGAKFLRVGNLDHDTWKLDLTDVQHVDPPPGAEGRRTQVKAGDILVSITAEIGMVGVVPPDIGEAYVNQHVAIARPSASVVPEYVAIFLASPTGGQLQFRSLERGATKTGLGLDAIRSLRIPCPSSQEQREIVTRVERILQLAERLNRRIGDVYETLARVERSAMVRVFGADGIARDDP